MALGIGIVSAAHGHVNSYAAEIKDMADARVAALWDDDAERGRSAAEKAGAEFVDDLDGLLARHDVQAVIIGSQTARHADHVEAAAAAGKGIVLQKPMALTMADCDRIARAVEAAGVPFSMAWQMRCDPQNRWMRDFVAAGRLGRVVMARRRHCLSTHLWPGFEGSWHVRPELNRGMFMDDASHPADWLLWMFGRPESVVADIETLINPKVPDDNGVAVFRWPDGMLGILECSFTCVAADDTTNLYGDRGTVLQRWGDGPSCTPHLAASAEERAVRYRLAGEESWTAVDIATPPAHGHRIRGVARPAVEFLLGNAPPIATLEEGRTNVRMLLACYESSETGRRVRV
ncbi:MAG TPA: Gfo/Idh/MocA family oxidoreductase [Phycisphaerae bacterium]|nr:Gfo/Idh/MocA family oxidoreductase [Phycisphaerae bacterium]